MGINLVFPAGMFGANDGDGLLNAVLRQVAVKFYAGDSTASDDPGKYGCKFEDDRFFMCPDYMDAECNCGFRDIADKWHEEHPHSQNCYGNERDRRIAEWDAANNYDEIEATSKCDIFFVNGVEYRDARIADEVFRKQHGTFQSGRSSKSEAGFQAWKSLHDLKSKFERKMSRALCKERGIPWNKGWGCAVHCDCGIQALAEDWFSKHDHDFRCPHKMPNFWWKATDLQVHWYKYIGRDMEANRDISAEEVLEIASQLLGRSLEQVAEEQARDAHERETAFAAMLERL